MSIPNPPNGYAGTPASDLEDAQAKFYGRDIWFDIGSAASPTQQADYVIAADGDVAIAEGVEALRQSLLRRLITSPGDWAQVPDYGVGAFQYVKALNTAGNRAELEGRIRSQFSRDPRVESVAGVTLEQIDDTTLRISVQVIATGRLRQDAPLPVKIDIK